MARRGNLDKWPGHLITSPKRHEWLSLGGGLLKIVEVGTYSVGAGRVPPGRHRRAVSGPVGTQ